MYNASRPLKSGKSQKVLSVHQVLGYSYIEEKSLQPNTKKLETKHMFRNLAQTDHAGYCLSILIRCCGYYTQPDDLEDIYTLQMLHWATVQPIWFWCTTEDLSVTALRTFWQVVLEFEVTKKEDFLNCFWVSSVSINSNTYLPS